MADILLRKLNQVCLILIMFTVGLEFLSMSKRIMNKVFDVSNDCGVKVYYQGTGSIHLNYGDVEQMLRIIIKNLKHDLVGDGLGNFHVDFPMDGVVTEIFGVESLCKKHLHIYFRVNRQRW